MKVLANDGLDNEGIKILEKAGFTVFKEKVKQENIQEFINKENIDVLLVRSATQVRSDIINNCEGLKLIGRGGVGMDNIDVDLARSKGITVVNTPAASSQSVAELVFAHLFTLCRFLHDSNRNMPVVGLSEFESLKKKYSKGIELRGKTMGIIGFGRIGQSVARYAIGLGMKILAYDSSRNTKEIYIELGGYSTVKVPVTTVSLEEVLEKSDFITLHVPAQKNGESVIGMNEINRMKKGVFLINTSRGGIIDEASLIEGLNSGKLGGAGLDVFAGEPKPMAEILNHPAISLTPHIGAATMEAQGRVATEIAALIIEALQPA